MTAGAREATPRQRERIPLNTFAICFGLAGLAEAWTALGRVLTLPDSIGQVAWAIAAVTWVWLVAAHLIRGARARTTLVEQLRHPAQGPIAALAPTTGMLVGADVHRYAPVVGTTVVLVCLAAAMLFAGWILATWFQGRLDLAAVHGGYLLPTVAFGLVAAAAAADVGLPAVGWAMFGIGAFFWAVMTTLLTLRLTIADGLPDALVPTMAILIAPPAVGGIAWFALAGPRVTDVGLALAGLTLINLLVQVALTPRYRRLSFSLGFWSFTFPAAAATTDAVMWLALVHSAISEVFAAVATLTLTVGIGAIAVRTVLLIAPHRGRRAAEAVIVEADDQDARAPTHLKVG